MALRYKKKPLTVEAMQLNIHNEERIKEFCPVIQLDYRDGYLNGAWVQTLEGNMYASYDDFIIKGVQGEFYPCKPDIFRKTYDLVDVL